jgi:hypothetical protein
MHPLCSNKTDIPKLIFLHTSSMIQGDYVVHLVGMHNNQVIDTQKNNQVIMGILLL